MWIFAGGDRFVLGVPARDLTDEEWSELPAEDRDRAEESGLYRQTKSKPVRPAQGVNDAA